MHGVSGRGSFKPPNDNWSVQSSPALMENDPCLPVENRALSSGVILGAAHRQYKESGCSVRLLLNYLTFPRISEHSHKLPQAAFPLLYNPTLIWAKNSRGNPLQVTLDLLHGTFRFRSI